MKKGLSDFDKLIEHGKITDKIIHNPVSIKEMEEVLNSLIKTQILYTSEKSYNNFNELLREEYYKLLNDV